jgi:hypothetical protein
MKAKISAFDRKQTGWLFLGTVLHLLKWTKAFSERVILAGAEFVAVFWGETE